MTEPSLTHYLKFEQKLRYFEGFISSVECISKDDGAFYCKFSVPLKQTKDDEPLWLNCRVFEQALAYNFSENCKKGAKVGLWGVLKDTQDSDGKKYINFYVKGYTLLREPTEKN